MDSRDSRDISGKKWAGLSDQKERTWEVGELKSIYLVITLCQLHTKHKRYKIN